MIPIELKRPLAAGLLLLAAGETGSAQQAVPDSSPASPCPVVFVLPPPSRWQRCKDWLRDQFLGYPSEFESPPLGFSVDQHRQVQISNGVAARLVLYNYDFVCGTNRLNPRGEARLARLAPLLSHYPFPLWIEPDPHAPQLAEARRLEVLKLLGATSLPIPPERVLVGGSFGYPKSGEEALLVHQLMLLQTRSAGAQPGTGAGPFGGIPGIGGFRATSGFGSGSGSSSGGSGGTGGGVGGR